LTFQQNSSVNSTKSKRKFANCTNKSAKSAQFCVQCDGRIPAPGGETTIAAVAMPLAPDSRLGPYAIVAPLGAGGMGEVYRARDTRLGREVAIKVLPERFAGSPEALARFEREARAVAALSHPNILALFDFGQADGVVYAVTELLKGETLRERLAHERLPERKAVEIATSIADGLASAHAAGIVHRDLKPENVFLTAEGRVKILDFGLARVDQPSDLGRATSAPTASAPTDPGVVMGTAAYMSPEQVRGKPADARSDLFAFGAVLYEMLTGERAFARESTSESMAAILRDQPPEVSRKTPGISPAIDRLVARCLEKSPDERFQSARDLAYALREAGSGALSGAIVAAAPATPSRWRGLGVAIAAALALAAFAAGWLLRSGSSGRSSAAPTVDRVARLTFGSGRNSAPAISPDGKWIAYLSDARGPTDVWVRFVAGGEAVNLTEKTGLVVGAHSSIGGLDISPDGSQIAFAAAESEKGWIADFATWVIPAPLGGVPRRLISRGLGARWSPDGRRLAYVSPGGGGGDALIVCDADGGRPKELQHTDLHLHAPAWSADGRFLYFLKSLMTFNEAPAELWRTPADGGAAERVVATSRRAIYPEPMTGGGLVYSADPDSAELALWWLPPTGRNPVRLTTGLGEYTEPRSSRDGRTIVATLWDPKESLATVGIGSGAKEARDLTNGAFGDIDPSLSPAGDRLVWSSARSGNRNLWIGAPDGSSARPLTTGNALDDHPAFSPDGKQVAYLSAREEGRGLWIVPSDGGTPRQIYRGDVVDTPSWSPDGKEILVGSSNHEVASLLRLSVADGRATPIATPKGALAAAWNPKEPLIAYLIQEPASPEPKPTRNRLAFIDPSGRPQLTEMPQSPILSNGVLVWAPDGRRLLALRRTPTTPTEFYVVDPRSPDPYHLVFQAVVGDQVHGATWSADGSTILIGLERPKSDIVLLATH
jgi:eukaryotic-like serine/threonine-protein kinase